LVTDLHEYNPISMTSFIVEMTKEITYLCSRRQKMTNRITTPNGKISLIINHHINK